MSLITTILGTDIIKDSRTTINANFSNLNNDKLESSDIIAFETASELDLRDSDNRDRANHTGTQNASTISSGTFADGRITQSSVTQHQSALTITESQITNLGNYQKVLSEGAFIDGDKTKLNLIEVGAEVNVNADWNAGSGDAQILNKPTIPTNNNQLANGAGYITDSFETISKNLKGYPYSLNFTGDKLTSIVYSLPSSQSVTKTFNYTGDQLDSIVLSGDTPNGINLTKSLTYTSGKLTSIGYS